MTSQESIGNCSLDVEHSASDRSEATIDSVSERTLHSLNLSNNGEPSSPSGETPVNGGPGLTQNKPTIDEKSSSNGDNELSQTFVKKPSYLGLACSISGYSGITRYDSKLREGFRSRDSSPGSRLITRESSPAGFRSSENLEVPGQQNPPKSQSISPLAMERKNGFTNGTSECKIQSFVSTRSSLNETNQGYTEVDRAVTLNTLKDISPIRETSSKNSVVYTREKKSFTSSIKFSSPIPKKNQQKDSNITESNDSLNDYEDDFLNTSVNSEKSFIQQRVERLYGPGALAQGFFFKRVSFNNSNSSNNSLNESRNNNSSLINDINTDESLKNLPVLRHLRPEFRAQLPVVSPRRPTDGTEQIIKPLQRLSVPVKKYDNNKSIILIDSKTDQQPAAPIVILPVIDIINDKSAPVVVDDKKDGHYFIKLLKAEIERLFRLAESAEAELDKNGGELPEEAAGKLRSAAGKARLLATQKMQQFEGLCQKNINQVPGEEFPTTDEDLAGFWDMVMLQVVQINDIFDHLDKLRKSQWQEIAVEKKTGQNNSTKRRIPSLQKPKTTNNNNNEASVKAREAREQARKKMIEERRKAMKSQVQPSVEIFTPNT